MQCLDWLNTTCPISIHGGPGKYQDLDLPNLYLNRTENSHLEMRKNHSQIFSCSNASWWILVFTFKLFKKPLPTTKTPTLIYAKEMEINQLATFSGKPHSIIKRFRNKFIYWKPWFHTRRGFFQTTAFALSIMPQCFSEVQMRGKKTTQESPVLKYIHYDPKL